MSRPHLLDRPTRHLFFTGKGGVGKTSLSTAGAVALADGGKQVLLVGTDAASNLDEIWVSHWPTRRCRTPPSCRKTCGARALSPMPG